MKKNKRNLIWVIVALVIFLVFNGYINKHNEKTEKQKTVYKLAVGYYYVTDVWKETVTVTPLPNHTLYEKVKFSGIIKIGNKEIHIGDIVEVQEWAQWSEAFWTPKSPRMVEDIDPSYRSRFAYTAKLVHERFPKNASLVAPYIRTQWSESGQKTTHKFSKISAPIVWSYGINGDGIYASVLVFTNDLTGESYHLVKAEEDGKTWERIYFVGSKSLFKKLNDNELKNRNFYHKNSKTKKWDYVDRSKGKYHGGF